MRPEKQKVIKLRKQGKSYAQINKLLGVPKSTLHTWLKDIVISVQAQNIIDARAYSKSTHALIKRNKEQIIIAEKRALLIREKASKKVKTLINNKLFLVGISLYWAEGYKKGAFGSRWKAVDFTNSDPEMIKIIMKFFRQICKVKEEKFKIQLIAHPNINSEKTVNYWSKLTGVAKNKFIKTCYSVSIRSAGKRNKNSLQYGTIHVRVYDVKLFFTLIGWIDGIKYLL